MALYLIDGYNVLHQLHNAAGGYADSGSGRGARRQRQRRRDSGGPGSHAEFSPDELEIERRRLIDRITSFMGSSGDHALIVFDSKAKEEQVTATSATVQVVYGSFSRSADAIIEREAYGLRELESIVVVTSDYGLQKTTFHTNVIRRSSRQFVDDLQRSTTKLAISKDCTTIGQRVEDRLDVESIRRLEALREGLEDDSGSG